MRERKKFYNGSFFVIGIPLLYAFALRGIFLTDFMDTIVGIVSITFLLFGPMAIGGLTIALSPPQLAKNILYSIFVPWVIIIIFLALTFVFGFEGAICLVMALPFFLVFSSAGGLIVYMIRKNKVNNTINIVAAVLIPFLITPIEGSLDTRPKNYEAYTTIVINSTKEKIWENVTRVRTIRETEDNGGLSKMMGFPRPIVAELDTLQVGGKRRAVFDKGLVFDETVNRYEHEKLMSFNITPLTGDIPAATLDEHVVVGGKYFTVLDGTYELVPVDAGKYKLILYSRFRLNTTFNFYSGLWAEWIMKDIQNNILEIIKNRCENS